MNAITPPQPTDPAAAARLARNLAACQRLVELGLSLAEAAHASALRNLAAAPETPATAPESAPAELAPAEPGLTEPAPPPPRTDPALTFFRAATAVRHAIALETRLAADAAAQAAPERPPFRYAYSAPPDPRRPKLLRAFKDATKAQALSPAIERNITERMDDALLFDPDHELLVGDLFASICKELQITPDLSRVHDDILIITPPHLVAPDGSLYPPQEEWPELVETPLREYDG